MDLSAFLARHWDPAFIVASECDCGPCASGSCQPSFEGTPRVARHQAATQAGLAPVDVSETEDSYAFEVDVPGLSKEQVKVQLEQQGSVLVLSGEREKAPKLPGHKYHRTERQRGKFERKFRLPKDAKGDEIKAAVKDGVLTVHVAKKKEEVPKVVEVRVQDS